METPSLSHMVKIYIHSQDELGISFCFCFLFPCFVGVFFLFKKNQISKEKKPHCTTLIYEKLKSTTVCSGSSMQDWHCCNMSYCIWGIDQKYRIMGKVVRVHKLLWIVEVYVTHYSPMGQGESSSWPIIMAHHWYPHWYLLYLFE
jgi:hypothetical protein